MGSEINKTLFTIGHSVHQIDVFLQILKKHNINTIVDIRSVPYSKFASQYNREVLSVYLKKHNIHYIFMGDLLGARAEDRALYFENKRVNFKKVQKTQKFQEGIKRLQKGIEQGFCISLMCSEKEAYDCHRFALVCEFLRLEDIDIKHIYPDEVLSNETLEKRLIEQYADKLSDNLFEKILNYEEKLQKAYELRNKETAYKLSN